MHGWVELDDEHRVIVNCEARPASPASSPPATLPSPAEQVLIAIGEGAKAALNVYEYLMKYRIENM